MFKRKLTRNKKKNLSKVLKSSYLLKEGIPILKELSFAKFDESVDISIHLGKNKNHSSNENLRGSVKLPYGTGKKIRILAIVSKEKEEELKKAGADYAGGMDYIEKIQSGWIDFDIIVTMPSMMNQLVDLGKILGPKGLMPNSNLDTISIHPEISVKEIRSGKIFFKTDRFGSIHSSIGRKSYSNEHLLENIIVFVKTIIKNKPNSYKGDYIKNIYLSTTMSRSISIDLKVF
ncbi:50S ribosomal protein L1 [Blattabacterium cuenoti]|uniref:50S ribosomal protein L1 n=1 Tax=Blattabacterium cuenoti TaxID=1653831 RepID=UPI00163C1789|nr:50S ribosomal protein L1 [Blattabacterium cuenoti]